MGRRRSNRRQTVARCARAATARVRICLILLLPHYGLLAPLVVVKCGRSGPAQIRTAVTATRRPKDTKLPHRPASEMSPFVPLTLPNGQRPQHPPVWAPGSRLEIPLPVATTPGIELGPTRRTRREHLTAAEPKGHDVNVRVPVSTSCLGIDSDTSERNRKTTIDGGCVGRVLFRAVVATPMSRTPAPHRQYAVYPSVSK